MWVQSSTNNGQRVPREGAGECSWRVLRVQRSLPSPLVGEGGSPHSGETGEGFSRRTQLELDSRRDTPHPALRATFSHKGRRKGSVRSTKALRRRGQPLQELRHLAAERLDFAVD